MTDCEQPRDAIEGGPEEIPVALVRGSDVDGHAHANPLDRREVFRIERALGLKGGRHRVLRGPKHGAKRVADRFENVALVRADRSAHQLVVATHGGLHRPRVAVPANRAAFDIGK